MDRQKIHKTLLNLKRALKDEKKGESFYLKVAEIAKSEGLNQAAEFFRNAAKDCKKHSAEIENVLYNLGD
jgi:rubrerythrin